MELAMSVMIMMTRASDDHSLLRSLPLIGAAKIGVRRRASVISLKAVISDDCFLYGDGRKGGGETVQKAPDIGIVSDIFSVAVSSRANILPFRL